MRSAREELTRMRILAVHAVIAVVTTLVARPCETLGRALLSTVARPQVPVRRLELSAAQSPEPGHASVPRADLDAPR